MFLSPTKHHWCNETYRRLAEHTGLSIGMISKTVKMLIWDGHLSAGEGARRLRDPESVLARR